MDQLIYGRQNDIRDTTNNIIEYIVGGNTLTGIIAISENILEYGTSNTALIINRLIANRLFSVSEETISSLQVSIYLLCLKDRKKIKLNHYAKAANLLDLEVPDFEYDMYIDVIDYYHDNPSELEILSYLFHN